MNNMDIIKSHKLEMTINNQKNKINKLEKLVMEYEEQLYGKSSYKFHDIHVFF